VTINLVISALLALAYDYLKLRKHIFLHACVWGDYKNFMI